MRRGGRILLVTTALAGATACGSGAAPAPTPAPAPPTTPPAVTTGLEPTSAPPVTPTAVRRDPLAFFQAQQGPCRQHADATANPRVESDRFAGARIIRDLGAGATLIEDGRGTRLVVEPDRGIVLPPSGNPTDLMPAPYGFGCSEKVFVGGAD